MPTQSVEEPTLDALMGTGEEAIEEPIGLFGTSEVEVDVEPDISVGEGVPRSHIER
jgi:hypothetical protein